MQENEIQQLKNQLRHFSGSEKFYKNPLFRSFIYTQGVKYLAEKAECFWLIDYIFSNQILPKLKGQVFQIWKIELSDNGGASFIIEDGNHHKFTQLRIGYTDFPLDSFTLWMVNGTLMLPSEY